MENEAPVSISIINEELSIKTVAYRGVLEPDGMLNSVYSSVLLGSSEIFLTSEG